MAEIGAETGFITAWKSFPLRKLLCVEHSESACFALREILEEDRYMFSVLGHLYGKIKIG